MRPTVYVPLDEIRRAGFRRAGATMAARFIAGRIAALGPELDLQARLLAAANAANVADMDQPDSHDAAA